MRTTRRIGVVWTLAAAALASLATVLALPGGSGAVTRAVPDNTQEPRISGSATIGSTLSASQGSWNGSPTGYAYQWVRCPRDGGLPSGADCAAIGGATTTKYVVASADVDAPPSRPRDGVERRRLEDRRVQRDRRRARGRRGPAGQRPGPTLSGTAAQGQTLHVSPGTWNGRQPITYTFRWVRCDTAGNNCILQQGFQDDAYLVREGDVGKTIRARVIARNGAGEASRLTAPEPHRAGAADTSRPVRGDHAAERREVDPGDERALGRAARRGPGAVLSEPAPLADDPITVRIKVKDTRGYVVRDALVFVRSTPLVTRNAQDQKTGQDGWLQLTVTPEHDFPELNPAYAVQFFVKAFRQAPAARGVAAYRLVQVQLG